MPNPDDVCVWKNGFTCYYYELEKELDYHGPFEEIVPAEQWEAQQREHSRKWQELMKSIQHWSVRP